MHTKLFSFRSLVWLLAILVGLFFLTLIALRVSAALRETDALGENLPSNGELVATEMGQIFILEEGANAAPPVLLAHGTAAWSAIWAPTLSSLAEAGFRAIAFDLPPFGFSEHAADGDYTRSDQGRRIIALLEALNIKPIIVAHSFGAGPVAEAVMARPDLVAGLVIVDGAIGLESHQSPKTLPFPMTSAKTREFLTSATATNPLLTRQFLRNFMFIKDAATPDAVDMLQRPMTRKGYTRAVNAWVPQLLQPPKDAASTRSENWQSLNVPTVFLWGAQDDVTPLDQAKALLALTPNAKLTVLPGVGHIPHLENPALFHKNLIKALRAL